MNVLVISFVNHIGCTCCSTSFHLPLFFRLPTFESAHLLTLDTSDEISFTIGALIRNWVDTRRVCMT